MIRARDPSAHHGEFSLSPHLDDWTLIRAVLTVLAVIPFTLFGTAGIWHFGGKLKSGGSLVSVASLAAFLAMIHALWFQDTLGAWSILGVGLQMIAVFLFGWCVGTSGKRNLSLAFSPNCSPRLMTEGPYSVVRHPFYTSYIIYWFGNAIVAPSLATLASAVVLTVIYLYASRREDAVLAERFASEFPEWYKNTGAFMPKLY